MFHKEGKRYPAVSDEGFRVDRKGSPITQIVLVYIEGDHFLEYPLENLMPGSIDPIIVSEIGKWNPPFNDEPIPDDKRKQIAERIVAAVTFVGDKAKVVYK